MLSCAEIMANLRCCAKFLTDGYSSLVIVTGNPGVFQGYPCPGVGVSAGWGVGFQKTRGYANPCGFTRQKQPKNLATAVQVSIDTAVQHCEVRISVLKWLRRWRMQEWHQNTIKTPLRLAVACNGGGGPENDHKYPPPARCCMRERWRTRERH